MLRALIWLVVLAALAGGGWWGWSAYAPKPAITTVPTTTPVRGDFEVRLEADGSLQSDDAESVNNGVVDGKLVMIVPDGTAIQKGQVFCKTESKELEQRLTQAELEQKKADQEIARVDDYAKAEYEEAKRQADQAEKELKLWQESNQVRIKQAEDQLEFDKAEEDRLRLDYERMRRMAEKGYVAGTQAEVAKAALGAQTFKVQQSQRDLELNRQQVASEMRQRKTAVEAAAARAENRRGRIQERIDTAKRNAESARKEMEKLKEALAGTTVRAPASGLVSLETHWVQGSGERVWEAGDQVRRGEELGTISGTEHMSVWCRIKESSAGSVWQNQKGEVEFEALPGRVFEGVVSSISAVARQVRIWEDPDAEPNQRVFDVWIKVIQKQKGRLRPGLNSKVSLLVKKIPNALYVPLESVLERGGRSIVYVKKGDRFEPREVKVGDRNEAAVVVLSGLAEGERLALRDPTRYHAKEERKAE